VLERRKKNSLWQLEALISACYKIDLEKIYKRSKNSGVIYKQHIMAELTDANYMEDRYKSLYKEIFKGQGICARDIKYADMVEAVKAIKADNGIAVLAHPGQLDSYEIIETLVSAGLDGIELNHEDHEREHHLKIKSYSKEYKLILTGGSEFVSIIGPSGAGKSTLLRCINRMINATEGDINFNGQSVKKLNKKDLRTLRTKIGMIFQHYNLVNRLSVVENVLHGRLGYKSTFEGVFGIYNESEKKKAFEILNKLGLEDQAYKRCDQLSGGQKQRVGIAGSLIQDPKMILCDEPIASLDPNASKIIMDHLKDINTEMGITCIFNLHQVDVALKYSDRINRIMSTLTRLIASLFRNVPDTVWAMVLLFSFGQNALTGTGIGYTFTMYYQSMNYNAASLVVIAIVLSVFVIEFISNYVRRVII